MPVSGCPVCGSTGFYAKSPEDEYETYDFCLDNGEVVFSDQCDPVNRPDVCEDTVVFCNLCSWHGALEKLKPAA